MFLDPTHPAHQKYLKFFFEKLYQFTFLSNGYEPAIRIFNKLTKVPFSDLRSMGQTSEH